MAAVAIAIACLATACGRSDSFTLKATIDGIGSQSVTMTYYADGVVNRVELVPDEKGVATFTGSASEPSVAEISLTGSGEVLALILVKNGEKIKCSFSVGNPLDITVKGYKDAELMATFIRENAETIIDSDFATLNDKIRDFIVENPSSAASTGLLVSQFEIEQNPTLADSLLNIINEEARPVNLIENFKSVLSHRAQNSLRQHVRSMPLVGLRDSSYTFTPNKQGLNLLVFTGRKSAAADSVYKVIRSLNEQYSTSKLDIVEISLALDSARWRRDAKADSAHWRRDAKADSAQWKRAWAPASAAAIPIQQLSVTRTPYFIVSDSLGKQLYRTPYASNAARFIRARAK